MTARALFISTYDEQAKLAHEIAGEMDMPLEVFYGGLLRGGAQYAIEHQDDFDVCIAFEGMGAYLESILEKPVVSVPTPFQHLLDTVVRASAYGNPVTVVCYKNDTSTRDFEAVTSIAPDLKCNLLLHSTREELEANLEKIAHYTQHTIIGAGTCIEQRLRNNEEQGLRFVMLESTRDMLMQALTKAKSIITLRQEERKKYENVNALLENTIEGVILLDKDDCIRAVNNCALKLCGAQSSELLGKNILDSTLPPLLRAVYKDGGSVISQNVICSEGEFVVNRLNIQLGGYGDESILTFRRLPGKDSSIAASQRWRELGFKAKYHFDEIVGPGRGMQDTIKRARRFAATDAPILVEGETGVGKELFVQSIHNASQRRDGPFVVVNCAALPEALLESELFGYEEGAFTGARKGGKKGLFELAHTGTLFLDEISASSPAIQSRLLRVLQEKEVMRVGGQSVLSVNVRIIAATNKNLYTMVQEEKFRSDLYFRLCRLKLLLPPLRARREDLLPLFVHFIKTRASGPLDELLKDLKGSEALLQQYSWPGNVREFEHFVESLLVLHEPGGNIQELIEELLQDRSQLTGVAPEPLNNECMSVAIAPMKEMQQEIVNKMLVLAKGNRTKVADNLQLSRATVWKMLKT